MAIYEYWIDGYVRDITRNKILQIAGIHKIDNTFSLSLAQGYTHYLTIEELRELYPYIGNNDPLIKVLYEKEECIRVERLF